MLTVLWDNDGVLVDTEGLYFRACRELLAEAGVELTAEAFREISLREGQSVFRLAAQRGVNEPTITALRARRDARYVELLGSQTLVIPGVPQCLQRLHGKVRMGVVTSSRRSHFDVIHARSGLREYFEFVVTLEDYPRSKPHPDPYLTALGQQGLHADACVVVEDSPRGLAAATAAGLRSIMVRTAWNRGVEFPGAYRVVESIAEIVPEVLQLCPA